MTAIAHPLKVLVIPGDRPMAPESSARDYRRPAGFDPRIHRQLLAAWLFVPYAAWVAFATVFNASIAYLN
nr:tryptophan-rich sensory protein [Rhizobium tubonense]